MPFKAFSQDMLYYQGDTPEELFFILQGKVQLKYDITEGMVYDRKYNIPFNMYTQGSYLGDIELLIKYLAKIGRDGTAEVDAESSFLFIQKANLYKVLKNFPNTMREMQYVANERRKRHQENIRAIKVKFEENRRDIIRSQMRTDNKYSQGDESKKQGGQGHKEDFLVKLRQNLIKKQQMRIQKANKIKTNLEVFFKQKLSNFLHRKKSSAGGQMGGLGPEQFMTSDEEDSAFGIEEEKNVDLEAIEEELFESGDKKKAAKGGSPTLELLAPEKSASGGGPAKVVHREEERRRESEKTILLQEKVNAQQEEIDAQAKRLEEVKAKNSELNAQMQDLEAQIQKQLSD